MKSETGQVFSELRKKMPGIQAFFLLGSGGELLAQASDNPHVDLDSMAAEYATLLRIIERTNRDTGMGSLEEQILLSSSSIVLAVHLQNDRFAVFVCSPEQQLGRLRYEVKRSLLYSSFSQL